MIHLDIPETILHELEAQWGNLSQAAKEALAIEAYRSKKLSLGQVAQMLGLSLYEADGFLKNHGVEIPYSIDDFEIDLSSLKQSLSE